MESSNFVKAFWYMSNNFGDNLNYFLLNAISGKQPVYTDNRKEPHFIACGSILSEASRFSTVWGAGFGWSDNHVDGGAKIITVRGELSQGLIQQQAKAFGDPALLLPRFMPGEKDAIYTHGIIPHWKDLEKVLWMQSAGIWNNEAIVINPLAPISAVVADILSCKSILSSSLHGLILADAYGVPNKWLDMGTEIGGDGFKFRDYYSTTDTPNEKPVSQIDFTDCRVHPYRYNLDELLKLCPFNNL